MKLPALLALMVLAHTAFTGGRVALSLSAIGAGGTPFQVGLVVSLLAVVPMFLSVHAGRWSDRQGLARPVLLALLMLAAGLLLATRPALATLGGAAVLLGCGFMLIHVAVNNAVGQGDAAAAHARGYSMLALGVSVPTIAGPMLAGVLVDLAGYARAFLALAVLPLLAMPVLLLVRRTGLAAPVPIAPAAKARVADLLRHPPLRAVFVVSALLSMGWDLFGFMLPVHGERIGLFASMIGAIMGAFGAGTFVVRLFVGTLGRRFTEWQLLGGALALSAAVYVAMPLLRAIPLLLALAFVLGLGLGCAMPLTMSAIARSAPAGRSGEAIGIRSMLANASQTILPLAGGAGAGAHHRSLPGTLRLRVALHGHDQAGSAVPRRAVSRRLIVDGGNPLQLHAGGAGGAGRGGRDALPCLRRQHLQCGEGGRRPVRDQVRIGAGVRRGAWQGNQHGRAQGGRSIRRSRHAAQLPP